MRAWPGGEHRALRHLADELAGRTFIHVNSTKAGGGVAEILNQMVPLMEELGIRTRWEVIEGTPAYYEVTKQIHNTLQGARMRISDEMWDIYSRLRAGPRRPWTSRPTWS